MRRNIDTYKTFVNESKSKNSWLETGVNDKGDDTGRTRVGPGDETLKLKVLRYIAKSGMAGVRYTDIIKFIMKSKGETYNYKTDRGHWATNLLGTSGYWRDSKDTGILLKYCTKNQANRWILKNEPLQKYFAKTDIGDLLSDNALDSLYDMFS
jgi:hypothetical protein